MSTFDRRSFLKTTVAAAGIACSRRSHSFHSLLDGFRGPFEASEALSDGLGSARQLGRPGNAAGLRHRHVWRPRSNGSSARPNSPGWSATPTITASAFFETAQNYAGHARDVEHCAARHPPRHIPPDDEIPSAADRHCAERGHRQLPQGSSTRSILTFCCCIASGRTTGRSSSSPPATPSMRPSRRRSSWRTARPATACCLCAPFPNQKWLDVCLNRINYDGTRMDNLRGGEDGTKGDVPEVVLASGVDPRPGHRHDRHEDHGRRTVHYAGEARRIRPIRDETGNRGRGDHRLQEYGGDRRSHQPGSTRI
jgi:hypothetical protein